MGPGSETYPRLGGSVPPRLCSVPINQCRSRSHCLMDLFFRSSSRADEPETGFAQKIIGGTQKKTGAPMNSTKRENIWELVS